MRRSLRQRSLPCEAAECVAVIPGDLVLCFQVLSFYINPILRLRGLAFWLAWYVYAAFPLKMFRKVKSRLFTLMPISLMRKDGDMMYGDVVVGF